MQQMHFRNEFSFRDSPSRRIVFYLSQINLMIEKYNLMDFGLRFVAISQNKCDKRDLIAKKSTHFAGQITIYQTGKGIIGRNTFRCRQ